MKTKINVSKYKRVEQLSLYDVLIKDNLSKEDIKN